jgi:hypothetical protein
MKSPKKNLRGRFVMLYQDMMESAAWASLDANARTLYVHIVARYNGKNNGRIPFSTREAALTLNVSKDTAARALKELIDRGLIEIVKRSAFNLKRGPDKATEYCLTEYPCKSPAKRRLTNSRNGGAEKTVPRIFHGPTTGTDRSD